MRYVFCTLLLVLLVIISYKLYEIDNHLRILADFCDFYLQQIRNFVA